MIYGAVLPSYSSGSNGKGKERTIRADDPRDRDAYNNILLAAINRHKK